MGWLKRMPLNYFIKRHLGDKNSKGSSDSKTNIKNQPPSDSKSKPTTTVTATTPKGENKMTIRDLINLTLDEEMTRDPNIFIMGEEVGEYQGAYKVTKGLLKKHGPKRIIDTPITECGFTGICVGAAFIGLKPICEFMTWNFAYLAIDHIINQASKTLYMSGGKFNCPIVFRGPNGQPFSVGAQHSTCLAPNLSHYPGLKVVAPYTAEDHRGLLITAIRDPDPVVILESETLYSKTAEINSDIMKPNFTVPLGKAKIERPGQHLTIVSFARLLDACLTAATILDKEGISTEIINLRSIRPLDMETIGNSLKKTHRLLIVEQCYPFCGIAAEISARVTESELFFELDQPILRMSQADLPVPYSYDLEVHCYATPDQIVDVAKQLCAKKAGSSPPSASSTPVTKTTTSKSKAPPSADKPTAPKAKTPPKK